jgi:hypothetical protein
MRIELPARLAAGPRVIKRNPGNGGQGVWKVEKLASPRNRPMVCALDATEDASEELALDEFLERCVEYFEDGCVDSERARAAAVFVSGSEPEKRITRHLSSESQRSRLGSRPTTCDHILGRCQGIRRLAVPHHWQELSAVDGGRAGICGTCRCHDGLSVGRCHRQGERELRRLRQPVGQQANGSGRIIRS